MQELQKIKLLEFAGGRASERAEAWLEGMTQVFFLKGLCIQLKG
jgi:hypothetical protein